MDLGYLREHPGQLATFLKHQRIRTTPVSGGSICRAERLTLDDGTDVFAKSRVAAPDGFFDAEAAGLRWLREAGGAPVPEVLAVTHDMLVLAWIPQGEPSPAAAERFGRELAATHRAGAPRFGGDRDGFLGTLPLDNRPGPAWPAWFAEHRLRPYLRRSVDNGALDGADAGRVEAVLARIGALAGPPEPPARLHGDLWPGNVVWAPDRAWLVDPAASGGHRETDLAMLRLWGGSPYVDRTLAAYDEVWPLADGWAERVPLHQLHLLLAHTALFGAMYRGEVLDAVRALS
ncbi:fructosamine kinase family protein [Actinocatenispora rupis]|uniref:Fructosamine kinase n=1 Tax=Actinocatenispora rupis TaxID=519421 RepID=A0A8J3NF56_9ACTN|nr:fructosamine kinase family protein [Actinocatenispora rupis]GID13379.1 fructosamine kinase [Actinocatenispora rupis]